MIKVCCETCHRICLDEEVVNLKVEVDGVKSTIIGTRCPTCKDYRCCVIYSRDDAKTGIQDGKEGVIK